MAESKQRVVLIRHGETEWSLGGQHTGRTDIPLTANGERMATQVGRALADRRFALILTSPLRRAMQTCQLSGFGALAHVRDDLEEWDYGAYEGLTTPQIWAQRPGWSLWRDGCPNGEDATQVGARADRVIAEARAAEGDVALFAHGHILRVLTARWLGSPPTEGRLYVLATGTISTLGYERDQAAMLAWNNPA